MTTVKSEVNSVALVLLSKEEQKAGQDKLRVMILNTDQEVHKWAVQALLHAEKHRDVSLMRRLLMDIIDEKTGYRRQGLINWVRKFSPIELNGKDLNLSGLNPQTGAKRPFLVEDANRTPFWTDRDNAERVGKPVFQDTLLSPINRAVKSMMEAVENTINGQPVDPKKPYFEGIHGAKIVDFAKKVQELTAEIPADATMEVRKAKVERSRLDKVIEEGEKAAKVA